MTRFCLALFLLFAGPAAFCAVSRELSPESVPSPDSWMGRVLVAEDPTATSAFSPQPEVVRRLVENGIIAFTGKPDEKSAWLSLVSTNDKIGIKVSSAAGASGTRRAVVEAVARGLISAGVPPRQITVWDRRLADLRQAQYFDLAERLGVRVAGALEAGYDPHHFYETALLGRLVYSDYEFGKKGDDVGRRSFVSALVTSNMTKIINIPPLLNHNLAGVIGCLHGLAMDSIDNVNRFEADPDRLGTAVPEIFALEPISDHVVLNIVDALISQYQGEEKTLFHYATQMNELWFSRDPVALDILSVTELAKQRKLADAPPLRTNLDIFSNAALLDLGSADRSRFRIERMSPKLP
jgi:hypothetical protein